ncbi:helix-turn-helix domain-containing protein [Clostridium sp.]|uniref:helix-turn-helix domain-containing protein n=1 Tax=Clostridium sp. TaxID=1506 RepID=UPI00261EE5FC|nr:helix-turn-helix transcriptional regulator [Clostridium sp.]
MLPVILTLLRKERNLTQEELADKLHVSRSGYAHYEAGDRKPSIDILIIIADFYGTSLDYLMGRTHIRNPYPKRSKRPK